MISISALSKDFNTCGVEYTYFIYTESFGTVQTLLNVGMLQPIATLVVGEIS